MSLTCFIVAYVMLAYDWAGHMCCLFVRIRAMAGVAWPARIWNEHSHRIWPRREPLQYDIYWSLWHGTTLALFTFAYWTKP